MFMSKWDQLSCQKCIAEEIVSVGDHGLAKK